MRAARSNKTHPHPATQPRPASPAKASATRPRSRFTPATRAGTTVISSVEGSGIAPARHIAADRIQRPHTLPRRSLPAPSSISHSDGICRRAKSADVRNRRLRAQRASPASMSLQRRTHRLAETPASAYHAQDHPAMRMISATPCHRPSRTSRTMRCDRPASRHRSQYAPAMLQRGNHLRRLPATATTRLGKSS